MGREDKPAVPAALSPARGGAPRRELRPVIARAEVEGLDPAGVAALAQKRRVRVAGTLPARALGCAGCFDQSLNLFHAPSTPPFRCPGCPVTRLRNRPRRLTSD